MFQWITRCVPGLSILTLLGISFVAFVDLDYSLLSQDLVGDYGRPPGEHASDGRPTTLPLTQKIFIGISLFVHLNAFYFAIRLFFALLKIQRESKKALQRRHPTKPKSEGTEDDFEAELAGSVPLNVLGATQSEAEPDYLDNNPEVIHAIILPNYEESFDTLWTTLHVLASHPRAASQYEIYLAMERKELEAPTKAASLVSTFETRFSHIEATFHPSGVPGEMAGKSSNVAYAAQRIINSHHGRDGREDLTSKLITVIDADTHLLQDYFNEIQRLHFDDVASPELSFYTCPIIFDRNSSETPILVRCADMMWAFAGVSAMYPGSPISIPTSVYTLPLSMAKRVGGWDSDAGAIGEDMHMLLKCYFAVDGNITTRAVASSASQCNISSDDHRGWRRNMDILAARYRQALRHMWGALDTGFCIRQSAANLSRPSWRLLFSGTQWALAHLLFEAHFLPCYLVITLAISSIYSAFIPPESMHPVLEWAFQFTGLLRICSFIMMNICMLVYGNWHNFCVNTRLTDMMDAGLPDVGFSLRNEWNGSTLLERVLFPVAGTLFGPIPAIQAVFSHFWTDRLVYKVSQKPSFGPSAV